MKNSSYQFIIDPAAHCFFIKHFGVFDLDIVSEGNKALEQHIDFKWNLNRLIDITGCTVALSNDEVRLMSERIIARETEGAPYKGLFLVDSPVAHGLVRVFGSIVSRPSNTYQILNVDAAKTDFDPRRWMRLDKEYVFPDFLSLAQSDPGS